MNATAQIAGSSRAVIARQHATAFSKAAAPSLRVAKQRRLAVSVQAHTVQLQHDGGVTTLEVPDGESILSVAIDAGLDVPHDCKLGVCMNCAAKLISGEVDQSAGMLSDDVKDKGYVLLCCALPQGDVSVEVIPEEELLAEVMQ